MRFRFYNTFICWYRKHSYQFPFPTPVHIIMKSTQEVWYLSLCSEFQHSRITTASHKLGYSSFSVILVLHTWTSFPCNIYTFLCSVLYVSFRHVWYIAHHVDFSKIYKGAYWLFCRYPGWIYVLFYNYLLQWYALHV